MKTKSILFRFSEAELENLDQLRDILQWKAEVNQDWDCRRKPNRTDAVITAIQAVLGELISQKRTWEEKQKPDPLPRKLKKAKAR
jgi:hypothetical protein